MGQSGIHRQIGNLACYVIKKDYESLSKRKRKHYDVGRSNIVDLIKKLLNDENGLSAMKKEMNYNDNEIEKLREIFRDRLLFPAAQIAKILENYNNSGLYEKGHTKSGEPIYGLNPIIRKKLEQGELVGNREMRSLSF